MRTLRFVGLALMFAVLCGCYRYRDDWETALRSRAAFELECDQKNVGITALTNETFGATDAPLYQGVTACGKRAVYVATISGYVLNSNRGDGAQVAGAAPPPVPPPAPAPVAPQTH